MNVGVKADGLDHKVAETDCWGTIKVQPVNSNIVEIIAKQAGKTRFTEIDAISAGGPSLTQLVKDTTEADTVTIETLSHRLTKGPADAHVVSGSWRDYKTDRSSNGSIIKYRCIAEGFSGETPLGEKFPAKFDDKF